MNDGERQTPLPLQRSNPFVEADLKRKASIHPHFQCRTFGLSVTSPKLSNRLFILGLRQPACLSFLYQSCTKSGLCTNFCTKAGRSDQGS